MFLWATKMPKHGMGLGEAICCRGQCGVDGTGGSRLAMMVVAVTGVDGADGSGLAVTKWERPLVCK